MTRPICDWEVERVRAYFRDHGIDPDLIAAEFYVYQLSQGLTASEIFAIAVNTRYDRPQRCA